jgi:iron(II)-dependent oxidoreductase
MKLRCFVALKMTNQIKEAFRMNYKSQNTSHLGWIIPLIAGCLAISLFGLIACSGAPKTNHAPVVKNVFDKQRPGARLVDTTYMVLIPAGEFEMGTAESEIDGLVRDFAKYGVQRSWFTDEVPRHTVYLDAFYMDVYEVTNAQYKKFTDATGHRAPECWNVANFNAPDQPVMGVSWEDAKAYCDWAGKRLPTEAEWEKAARGGLVGKRYVWGDTLPPPKGAGNIADKYPDFFIIFEGYDDGYFYPAPVGKFTPNGYGLYDMVGNAWEWCADWYAADYYAKSPARNPQGTESGSSRVCRGGSWNSVPGNLRVGKRNRCEPAGGDPDFGFRCVWSPGFLEHK